MTDSEFNTLRFYLRSHGDEVLRGTAYLEDEMDLTIIEFLQRYLAVFLRNGDLTITQALEIRGMNPNRS